MRLAWPTLLSIALAPLPAPSPAIGEAADPAYRAEISKWRAEREARLKADGGWLTVVGLFWLREGENSFGTDAAADLVLPAGAAPPRVGTFVLAGRQVSVRPEPGAEILLGGRPLGAETPLRPDSSGRPDVIEVGPRLSLHVIERGGRFAIRLKDKESAGRREFTGLHWYDVEEAWRVTARFVAYPEPKPVPVPNVLGRVEPMPSPGYAEFAVGGKTVRLDGVLEEPDASELFFIFRDATSGHETYGSGRFLYTDLPRNGQLTLDFNKAYNPPCAFTAFATCPLPPRQNALAVRIEAGEKAYGKAH